MTDANKTETLPEEGAPKTAYSLRCAEDQAQSPLPRPVASFT